jgi:hypothetical protein
MTRARLRDDERGAVMVIGLFMAMFLIGAMWTVVGLGDAIVFRDRAQEAVDHMAYTSATVHARGMNFVCALNLVMLAIVAVWLVMDAVDKILNLLRWTGAALCPDPYTAAVGCPIEAFAEPAYESFHQTHEAYKKGMQPVLTALSWTQSATAMLAPYGGAAAAVGVGEEYKMPGVAFSIAMLPEFAVAGGLANGSYDWGAVLDGNHKPTGNFGGDTPMAGDRGSSTEKAGLLGQRIGLPIKNEKMNKLCIYSADYVIGWVFDWLDSIPIANLITKVPGLESSIENLVGSAIAQVSCDEYTDGFWKRDGPKTGYGMQQDLDHGQDDYHQVYAIGYATEKDLSERKVALAMGPKKGFGQAPSVPEPHFYVAQAEFFYDCAATWQGNQCNGAGNLVDLPRAMYSMRWMVRLRRVHFPSVGQLLSTWLSNTLVSGNVLGPLKGKIAGSEWFKNVEGSLAGAA